MKENKKRIYIINNSISSFVRTLIYSNCRLKIVILSERERKRARSRRIYVFRKMVLRLHHDQSLQNVLRRHHGQNHTAYFSAQDECIRRLHQPLQPGPLGILGEFKRVNEAIVREKQLKGWS